VGRSATLTLLNSDCTVAWKNLYRLLDVTQGSAVRIRGTNSDRFVLAGTTGTWDSTGAVQESSVFVMQTNNVGSPQWTYRYGAAPFRKYSTKIEMKNCADGYIVCGTVVEESSLPFDDVGFLLRLDLDGNMLWMKYYSTGETEVSQTHFKDVEELPNGNFVVTGHMLNPDTPNTAAYRYMTDTILLTLDSEGNFLQGFRYPAYTIQDDGTENLDVTSGESLELVPGGVAVVGFYMQPYFDSPGSQLFQVDNSGFVQWYNFIPGIGPGRSEIANGTLRYGNDDTLTFTGDQSASALVQFNSNGSFIAAKKYGTSNWRNTATSVYAEADNSFTFTGISEVSVPLSSGYFDNRDCRIGRTSTSSLSTGCNEQDLSLTPVGREVLPISIEVESFGVQGFIDITPAVIPVGPSTNVLCTTCDCLPPVVVGPTVQWPGDFPVVVIDWEPVDPGSITDVVIIRDGVIIGDAVGTTYVDETPNGYHRYELIFNPADDACNPTHKTFSIDTHPVIDLPNATDLVWIPDERDLLESTCVVAGLVSAGRTPKIVFGDSALTSVQWADFGSAIVQQEPVAWALLGDGRQGISDPLSPTNEGLLIEFMVGGGSLYLESVNLDVVSNEFKNLCGFSIEGSEPDLGVLESLEGLDSGFGLSLSGLSTEYVASGQYVDRLAPEGSSSGAILRNTSPSGEVTAVFNAGGSSAGDYKVVTSSTLLRGYLGNEELFVDRLVSVLGSSGTPNPLFIRGDGNGDGGIDIGDAVYGLTYLFSGGESRCQDAQDTNDDGAIDVADPIALLGLLFSGSEPPPAPFPDCGEDPTPDSLSCELGTNGCP